MYANAKGCDGGRLYFDGSSLVTLNGVVYSQSEQFSIGDVDVDMAVLDLDQVRAMRMSSHARSNQS